MTDPGLDHLYFVDFTTIEGLESQVSWRGPDPRCYLPESLPLSTPGLRFETREGKKTLIPWHRIEHATWWTEKVGEK